MIRYPENITVIARMSSCPLLKMRRQLFNAQTSEGIQKYLIPIYQVGDQWLGAKH